MEKRVFSIELELLQGLEESKYRELQQKVSEVLSSLNEEIDGNNLIVDVSLVDKTFVELS